MQSIRGIYCFLCVLLLLLTGCENSPNGGSRNGDSRNGHSRDGDSTNRGEEEAETDSRKVYIRSGADTLLKSDSLMQRFVPQWDVRDVMDRLPDAEISEREPVENRHIPGQVDTLLTLSNGNSRFRFYQLPDEVLLQSASLRDEGLVLGGELEPKMPVDVLRQVIPGLQDKDTLPELIHIEGEIVPQSLLIRLNASAFQVEEIEFRGYVD